jgi:hypothetical protein
VCVVVDEIDGATGGDQVCSTSVSRERAGIEADWVELC